MLRLPLNLNCARLLILAFLVVNILFPVICYSNNTNCNDKQDIYLQACIIKEERANCFSINIPTVEKIGHQLLFCDGCEFSELKLLTADEKGRDVIIYDYKVKPDIKIIKLPNTIKGEYELQLVYTKWYLWGIINL